MSERTGQKIIIFYRSHHIEQWEWAAEQAQKLTSASQRRKAREKDWPGFAMYPQPQWCFTCWPAKQFVKDTGRNCCEACPLVWESDDGRQLSSCVDAASLYVDYYRLIKAPARELPKNWQSKMAAIARRIAYLPISRLWTDELARDTATVQVI